MLNIENELFWEDLDKTLKSNHVLNKPILLFRIIEDKEIKNQVQQLKNNRLFLLSLIKNKINLLADFSKIIKGKEL